MPTMYKLVTQDWTTRGNTEWAIGKTVKANKEGTQMCTSQVLHCYASPDEAVLFNIIHATISNPILLEIECSEIVASDGLKYACKEQTPIREIPLPVWTNEQRVAFAIKCVLAVYKNATFVSWAEAWLNGTDRNTTAANAADAAYAAADAAVAYAAANAANAANAADAAYAAYTAAYAAYAAYTADAAAYAAYAANAAYTADAAAYAANFKEIIVWVKTGFKG